jgi:hypothetical protein
MDTRRLTAGRHVVAITLYAAVALAFSWPLPLHLTTHLTGSITGDTGVYVWNQWVFRHELLTHHRFPMFTREVLGLRHSVDLSLHNYTLFADLVAFPLLSVLDVVTTFNVVYLLLSVMTAWAMFVLARTVIDRTPEAWLAGALFGFAPVFTARSIAHFSLASAAPLPLFVLALRRGHETGNPRYSLLAGAVAGWAATWDAYYGIFCVVIAVVYFAAIHIQVSAHPEIHSPRRPHSIRVVDGAIACIFSALVAIVLTDATDLTLFGERILLRPLHTPVLALTLLVLLRWWICTRPIIGTLPSWRTAARHVAVAAIACGVVLLPVLIAFGYQLADGGSFHGPIFWRSSPPGVDLLALFLPNPTNQWVGGRSAQWLTIRPNGYPENAASLPLVAVALIAIAAWRCRFRPAREWVWLTVFFGLLALGPFIHVGGINTYIPTPWTFLRYAPLITATRTPARYAIPLVMAFAVVFALALSAITLRAGRYRPLALIAVTVALLAELSPWPRPIYAAHVPDIFKDVAADPRDVRVLHLPFGVRSGEWSAGDFSAAAQFFQTFHGKRLVGGYLSRVSNREIGRHRRWTDLSRLIDLSEGRAIAASDLELAKRRAPAFVARARLGYVVMETARVSDDLRRYATEVLRLRKIAESDGYELFVPEAGLQLAADPGER